MVVYNETTSVVTCPFGQFVTSGAHDVMVAMLVEYTVDRVLVVTLLLAVYVFGGNSRTGVAELNPVLFPVEFAEGNAKLELKDEAT